MAASKETIVTPKGVANYPFLDKPKTKIGDKTIEPTYSVDLIFDESEPGVKEFKAKLDELTALGKKTILEETKDPKKLATIKKFTDHQLWKPVVDDDGNEVEGKFLVTFKNKAEGKNLRTGETFTFRPDIRDSKRNRLESPGIGSGSILKVAFSWAPFTFPGKPGLIGATLRLKAVQVLKLERYTGGSGDAFGEEEDGYTIDDQPAAEGSEAPAEEKF